jgi:hypothetical protein
LPHPTARASRRRSPRRRQDRRHRLGVDRLDNSTPRRRQETVDVCGPGIGLDFVPRSPLNSVQIPAKAPSDRSSLSANQTTSWSPDWAQARIRRSC